MAYAAEARQKEEDRLVAMVVLAGWRVTHDAWHRTYAAYKPDGTIWMSGYTSKRAAAAAVLRQLGIK